MSHFFVKKLHYNLSEQSKKCVCLEAIININEGKLNAVHEKLMTAACAKFGNESEEKNDNCYTLNLYGK